MLCYLLFLRFEKKSPGDYRDFDYKVALFAPSVIPKHLINGRLGDVIHIVRHGFYPHSGICNKTPIGEFTILDSLNKSVKRMLDIIDTTPFKFIKI